MGLFLADAWLHTLDPFAIELPQSLARLPLVPDGIRWYGLSYLAGFVIAWWLIRWLARTGRSPIAPTAVGDLMFYVIAGVILGGRLGYVLLYDRSLLMVIPEFPYWGVLAISQGGMASHGGMIGVIVACLLFARWHGVSKLHLLDVGALAAPPGLFLGRLANFINGELIGRACSPGLPWAVKFPQEVEYHTYWPAQRFTDLLAALGGDMTRQQVVHAVQRGERAVIDVIEPMLAARHPSQVYQAITDGPLLMGLLALIWMRPRKPGVVGAWFLIVYALLRIVSEQFRTPDEGVAAWLGLTRGQWLSILMLAAGAAALVLVARREAHRLGGLLWPAAPPALRSRGDQ
jgi:phosphatidylglycerol:prolipoprotein diacylglycerol transferase